MTPFRRFLSDQKELGEVLFLLKLKESLFEDSDASRYSVEVNFRSKPDEVLEAFAKIALGYVSAGIKQHNFHVKHVYTDKPIRILI